MPPTDPTPRDVTGEPLRVGRWYTLRSRFSEAVQGVVVVRDLISDHAGVVCVSLAGCVAASRYDWLPADGPPAWPGEEG